MLSEWFCWNFALRVSVNTLQKRTLKIKWGRGCREHWKSYAISTYLAFLFIFLQLLCTRINFSSFNILIHLYETSLTKYFCEKFQTSNNLEITILLWKKFTILCQKCWNKIAAAMLKKLVKVSLTSLVDSTFYNGKEALSSW